MTDLIERLRMGTQVPEFELRQEAADEIERLRTALERIENSGIDVVCNEGREIVAIAREVLDND